MDDLVSDFIAETREGLEALDSELVRFEQHPDDPETLGGIFRLIHTIKGTCGFLGLMRLQTVAHAAENVLGGFRDGVVPVTPTAVSAVLDTVDLIRSLTDALAESGAEPEGDDSALIARLEAVLEADGAPEAPVETPAAAAPAMATPADNRSLIERLGGDASLDAAAEMTLPKLRGEGGEATAFSAADPDRLQAALRDGLIEVARKQAATGGFAKALGETLETSLDAGQLAHAFDVMAASLRDLDVADRDVTELRDLALPAAEAEPEVEPMLEVAPPPVIEAVAPPPPAPAPAPPVVAAEPPPAPPAAQPAPAAKPLGETETPRAAAASSGGGDGAGPAQTIRVSVDALEHLMTVVSELVLIRNQLIQTLRLEPESPFAAPLNRLNQVTSELQEGVMTTRMQPISGAWAKLPRLVRDLAQDLGKKIDLVMYGQETELDRQVLELIKDPLTHMIRNAADHGLETPADRRAAGKSDVGRITLQARHEGGAIVIEVADDGRGLSAEKIRAKALATGLVTPTQAEQMSDADARSLIFLPGFSTASQVTSVSGRGVGMDVVRTNIEKIGGAIDVSSVEGGGTRFTIRIPLTLTIVSALIVECCDERFAIPQSSVVELVSASGASGASGRAIEYIDGSAVLRLRDRLLPLVSLQSLLGLEASGEPSGETCIVVCRVGAFTFGVIVDRVFDTEEIVVKPVATVLRHLKLYSGATILGDGSVILILDPKGMSSEAGAGQGATATQDEAEAQAAGEAQDRAALLVFRAANDALKAAPLASVSRIEEVAADQIERVDGRAVIQYRGKLMPILGADAQPAAVWEGGRRPLLVFAREDRAVGLLVEEIVDIVESAVSSELDSRGEGAMGSLIIAGKATELIDVGFYWRRAVNEDSAEPRARPGEGPARRGAGAKRLLVVDSSPFSQLLLRPLLAQAGYEVTVAVDADAALNLYDSGQQFHLIMADTRPGAPQVKAFAEALGKATRWHGTPLLSLAMQSAGEAGVDKTTLLDAVSGALDDMRGAA
ncbi:hybrid sensor histidine kinase/response regulator [Phenylobacterium soli]|uniref:Chemotaxis protein CheA n=1 Tax=Phenylobacterium soli TaxID=2170551 RepID=A0A328AK10_9CAUL|nr:hybrid sensor histidine kinase/response regulator [Phenylobacterium soli]RAK54811.1 hybrid sensor histidine kinase/response regulator [Phenylobacterium soli]